MISDQLLLSQGGWPNDLLLVLIVVLVRLGEQPTFVGGVLEVRRFAFCQEYFLVSAHLAQVHRAVECSEAYYAELDSLFALVSAYWSGAVSAHGGVLAFGCPAEVVAGAEFLTDFARDMLNRVFEYY